MPRRLRRTAPAAALLIGVLALAGCGEPLVARISSDPSATAGRAAKIPATPYAHPTPTATATATATQSPSDEPAVITPSAEVSLPSADPALVPVLHRIPTTDPVVFVTIDDGYEKDPAVVALLQARHAVVTPFLAVNALQKDHEYFARLQSATGQRPQDHTLTHPHLSRLSYERQRQEICGAADQLGTWYGTRPWLLRPPYGDYSATTRRAAKDCGMTAIVLWDVSLPHHVLRYGAGPRLQPGDIILIHWRKDLAQDLPVALDAIEAAGLRVGALQDYLPAPS